MSTNKYMSMHLSNLDSLNSLLGYTLKDTCLEKVQMYSGNILFPDCVLVSVRTARTSLPRRFPNR